MRILKFITLRFAHLHTHSHKWMKWRKKAKCLICILLIFKLKNLKKRENEKYFCEFVRMFFMFMNVERLLWYANSFFSFIIVWFYILFLGYFFLLLSFVCIYRNCYYNKKNCFIYTTSIVNRNSTQHISWIFIYLRSHYTHKKGKS